MKQQMKSPSGDMSFDLVTEAKNHLASKHGLVDRIKISLVTVFGISLLMTLTGCIGWVGGGGGYGDGGWWGGPVFVGGGYDRGGDVHAFSARGAASRGAAHGGGGRR